jgi:hypothetical protein
MADEEAEVLNEELVAIATWPENTYRHIWSAGDIVIWTTARFCITAWFVMKSTTAV